MTGKKKLETVSLSRIEMPRMVVELGTTTTQEARKVMYIAIFGSVGWGEDILYKVSLFERSKTVIWGTIVSAGVKAMFVATHPSVWTSFTPKSANNIQAL